jgi:hypothetical protein
LVAAARSLLGTSGLHRPALVHVHRRAGADEVVVHPLYAPDPVDALVGRIAAADVVAVGLRAPARSRLARGQGPVVHGVVVHLVDRTGTSVTVAPALGPLVVGPTREPIAGRAADACRRMLGLPTAPAPPPTVDTVVLLWLSRLARVAAGDPRLDWPGALSRLPRPLTPTATPADAAAALRDATVRWSWEELRRAVAAGNPDAAAGCAEPPAAGWMDGSMLARWVEAELPPLALVTDVLDATLAPGTVDRIRAAARLGTGSPAW